MQLSNSQKVLICLASKEGAKLFGLSAKALEARGLFRVTGESCYDSPRYDLWDNCIVHRSVRQYAENGEYRTTAYEAVCLKL